MQVSYSLLLFIITFAGGSIPLWTKRLKDLQMNYLLAFSGSFLLSITFLHLLPETFAENGGQAGIYLLFGFFLQLIIQRFTHGIEHGHLHTNDKNHLSLAYVLLGLSLHAFMEGLPLGVIYQKHNTLPSLYFAVAAHKLPEAMLVTALLLATKTKKEALLFLTVFALITPVSSIMTQTLSVRYLEVSKVVAVMLPIVAGAFIHISTTIFFESGTKQHMLTRPKVLAILLGLSLGLASLIFE